MISGDDLICSDLSAFLIKLGQLRKADDSIMLELNNSLPTRSFDCKDAQAKCQQVKIQLENLSNARRIMIERCISYGEKQQKYIEDPFQAKLQRNTMRSMKNELDVENIVGHRTKTAVDERCHKLV